MIRARVDFYEFLKLERISKINKGFFENKKEISDTW
jgi:hypothetical protein